MARSSITVLSSSGEGSRLFEVVREAASKSRLGYSELSGSYDNLLETVADWAVLPEIVLFDLPEEKDVFEALEDLSERFPEGPVELILTGVRNDITTYRKLKQMGVSEVFPEDPNQSDIEKAIHEIATRELRLTEIDPRRVVYVWSSSGGAGGTTIALAFSKHMAKTGHRTLFLDMDIHSAPASYMFSAKEGARETYGLIEGLMNPKRIDAVFLERAIQKVEKNLFYLSARKKVGDKDFDPAAMSVLVSRAQKNFDMVIVDTPWRPVPEVDWGKVNGTSFIVASPTPTSYLGFSAIAKELASTPSQAIAYGIINKSGEFRSNDFTPKMFGDAIDGDVFVMPYDPQATGKLFFAQKTLVDIGGKIAKPLRRITDSLPNKSNVSVRQRGSKKKSGILGFGGKST